MIHLTRKLSRTRREAWTDGYRDIFAPPGTDTGDVPNAMWPLGLSHNRAGSDKGAGWARQQNTEVLPNAKAMAGVDMRLSPGAYRELHWHTGTSDHFPRADRNMSLMNVSK